MTISIYFYISLLQSVLVSNSSRTRVINVVHFSGQPQLVWDLFIIHTYYVTVRLISLDMTIFIWIIKQYNMYSSYIDAYRICHNSHLLLKPELDALYFSYSTF